MISSLPLEQWPEADRAGWEQACRLGERLKKGGLASRLKRITQRDLARRYGYFLQFLQEAKVLDLRAAPAGQVTPEYVGRYIERVRSSWSSVTLAQSIYKLRRMAQILSPTTDFMWLADIEKDLALVAYPKARFDRIVTTEILIEVGLTLVKEAQLARRRRPIWRASQMRDGLMLAMLAYHPIRLKNFAQLELGKNFVREDDRWLIALGRQETKAKRPDVRAVEDLLQKAIGLYLTWARPRLMHIPGETILGNESTKAQSRRATSAPRPPEDPLLSGPLWIGICGEQLSYSSIDKRLRATTLATLGVALSAHDFRRCAAVTARFHAGSEPHLASGLLQHVDPQVVDENYNLASSMAAALRFGEMITDLGAALPQQGPGEIA